MNSVQEVCVIYACLLVAFVHVCMLLYASQIAAADAWCLLANHVDPQKVCDVSREEDMFVELVTLLGSSNTEVRGPPFHDSPLAPNTDVR